MPYGRYTSCDRVLGGGVCWGSKSRSRRGYPAKCVGPDVAKIGCGWTLLDRCRDSRRLRLPDEDRGEHREQFVTEGFKVTLNGQEWEKPARSMLLDGKQDAKVIALRLELPPKVTPTGPSGFWPGGPSSWGPWTRSVTRLSGACSKKRNHEPEHPVLGDSARTGRGSCGCHGGSPGRWTRSILWCAWRSNLSSC